MSFVQCRRLVALLLCGGAAVLVIVNGQSTIDDDIDTDKIAELRARVAQLEGYLAAAIGEIAQIKEKRGTTYTRWGRKTCQSNATLVYQGYAAGPHHNEGGGGSNFLCLPEDPEWKSYIEGHQRPTGSIYGVEYELASTNNIFSEDNSGGSLGSKPAPCAFCYLQGRSTAVMIPARTQCPDGWTTEYAGYIISEYSPTLRHRSNYICWDEAPEVAVGGTSQDQAVIYPVEVECGSLPCSVYTSGRELTCVVCSK